MSTLSMTKPTRYQESKDPTYLTGDSEEMQRKKRGRSGTILSGTGGAPAPSSPTAKKTLLGA